VLVINSLAATAANFCIVLQSGRSPMCGGSELLRRLVSGSTGREECVNERGLTVYILRLDAKAVSYGAPTGSEVVGGRGGRESRSNG
jgi:hypothetical protein